MEDLSTGKVRRTWFRGYRASDVQVLLAQASLRITQLLGDLDATRARLEAAESERRELTQRVHEAHVRELELVAAAETARKHAAEEARVRAEEVVETARLDAARIRTDAAVDAERVRSQVEDLLRLRESLAATMRLLTRDFERVMKGESLSVAASSPAPQPTALVPSPEPAAPLFDRSVQIDAGPFADFASLSAFEQALGRLPKVGDVYVRSFEGDRATIEVTLDEPAPLLDDLTARLPYTLSIDSAGDDRIALSISTEA